MTVKKKTHQKAPVRRGNVGRPVEIEIHGGQPIAKPAEPQILGHPIPEAGKVEIIEQRRP